MTDGEDKIWMPGDPSLTWFEYERVMRECGREPTQAVFIDLRDGYYMNRKTAEIIEKMWRES